MREFHVPHVLESPLNQRRQLRVLLRREQHRRGRDSLLQIPERRLTQHAPAADKVQNVVLELKRQTEVSAVVVRMAGRLRVVPAEEHDGLGAVGDERRGFEVRLLKVVIEGHEPLGFGGHLHNLSRHQVLEDPRQQLDDLRVAQRRKRDGRAREQEIAREDRQLVPNLQVQRPQTASRRGAVQHVVVQKTRDVDELGDLSQPLLSPPGVVRNLVRGGVIDAHARRLGAAECVGAA